jgi:hypothetical protein
MQIITSRQREPQLPLNAGKLELRASSPSYIHFCVDRCIDSSVPARPLTGKNRPLVVADELVEFEELPADVQGMRKLANHFVGIYGICLQLLKKVRKTSTWNRWHLETNSDLDRLCPKISPDTKTLPTHVGVGHQ